MEALTRYYDLMLKQGLHIQIDNMKEFFERSTRALTEDDSKFSPTPDMYTAAQQVAHAAQTVDWFMDAAFSPSGFDMDFETMDKGVRAVGSLAAAKAWLAKAFTGARAVIDAHSEQEWSAPLPPGPIMGGAPKFSIFNALTDHTAHHRGALTVYARLIGKVPPMPYMDM